MNTIYPIYIPATKEHIDLSSLTKYEIQKLFNRLRKSKIKNIYCTCNKEASPKMFLRENPKDSSYYLVKYKNSHEHNAHCSLYTPTNKPASHNSPPEQKHIINKHIDIDLTLFNSDKQGNSFLYDLGCSLLKHAHNKTILSKGFKSSYKIDFFQNLFSDAKYLKSIFIGPHNNTFVYLSDVIFNPLFINTKSNYNFTKTISKFFFKININNLSSNNPKIPCYLLLKYDSFEEYNENEVKVKLSNPYNPDNYCYVFYDKYSFIKQLTDNHKGNLKNITFFISTTVMSYNNYLKAIDFNFIPIHSSCFLPISTEHEQNFLNSLVNDFNNPIPFIINNCDCSMFGIYFKKYTAQFILLNKSLKPVAACDIFGGHTKKDLLYSSRKFKQLVNDCSQSEELSFIGYFPILGLDIPRKHLSIIRNNNTYSCNDNSISYISNLFSIQLNSR